MDDGAIVGVELHGLKRRFLSTPFYAAVFEPVIQELEGFTGASFDDGLRAEGHTDELPRTTRLLIFMIGEAVAKFEALRRSQFEDAGRALLAVP